MAKSEVGLVLLDKKLDVLYANQLATEWLKIAPGVNFGTTCFIELPENNECCIVYNGCRDDKRKEYLLYTISFCEQAKPLYLVLFVPKKEQSPVPVAEKRLSDLITDLAQRASATCTNVLITGETGTGKSRLARVIHNNSQRTGNPFITINCAAIPPTLLESELFGYEKGAFTGANKMGKIGLIEAGNYGTVFLDEISELPLTMQAKILYVIEEKKLMRIGSRKEMKMDIRFIAATNQDLEDMVQSGDFRKDLFYRLNIFPIKVPSLRQRKSDIPFLVNSFLKKVNEKYNENKIIDPGVMDIFLKYHWPGNIRELQNIVEQLVIVSNKKLITVQELPDHICQLEREPLKTQETGLCSYRDQKITAEREIILKALGENRSIRAAARQMGIGHSTLLRKIKIFNIDWRAICSK
ncbi:sigma-54 interaction domain-containing protein [Desulfocucumis palustris]|uniref:sigma-54 interaction domain-containing protein n=1 Tax=Desulfocucumis palustris TaxID=1898651 RepID=UPI000FFF01F1|nr:sigma 54-interacting transcriptional regulator [Desulfocucumis palustris]